MDFKDQGLSVRLIFSTNQKIGAKLIRWGAESDCSHFAVEFDGFVVLQSNMLQGVNLTSTNEFLNHNEIIHQIKFNCSLENEESVWKPLVTRMAGKSEYDKKAMLYWALQIIKRRICGTPFPDNNKWNNAKKFMCIEIAQELPDFIFNYQKPADLSLTGPEQLFHLIDSLTKDSPMRVYE